MSKMTNPVQTTFGLIPEMPEELSKSEVAIVCILGNDGARAVKICMPHQLYAEKLKELMKKGKVVVYPASDSFPVKMDEKKIWIGGR